ncbi:MAG: lipopolysaccharide kinase InaA family protein [Dysgonamonadaceae bacterium]|nr:lipopolysaccharide kinase InaA family protein [Dysgonamonadaceae bacterium]
MKIVINPAYRYLEDFIRKIPDTFEQGGQVIYAERNTIKRFEEKGVSISVKSFHVPFFLNQIVYGFFRLSKARRSYEYGLKLLEKEIPTPEPIAYIEQKRFGLLQKSCYICAHLEYDGMMREFRTGALTGRENLLRSFARFAAFMHEQGVYHRDFSPGNILYVKNGDDYRFYLVDINRMEFLPVDMKKGCKNLKRLWGNDEMIAFIAKAYADARLFDAPACEKLTFEYHRRFWKKYGRKHNGFLPYIGDAD